MAEPEKPIDETEQDETVEESGAGYGNNAGVQGEDETSAKGESTSAKGESHH